MSEFSALPERGTSSSPEVIPDTEFDTDEVHAAENLITRLEADIKIINAKLKKIELSRFKLDRDILRAECEKYDLNYDSRGSARRFSQARARNSALLRDIDAFQRKMTTRTLACPLKERRLELQRRYQEKSVRPFLEKWLAQVEKHQSYCNVPKLFRIESSTALGRMDQSSSFGSSWASSSVSANFNYGPPLDYSFRNISSLERGVGRRAPRQSLRKQRRSPSGRYNSNVIRLANNNLADTTGLYKMALDVVEFPEDIAWLDLSFNEIGAVSNDILEFPALKMLYLHGNKIRRFADLSKLQQLPNLYSLTLHGNPIENFPNYRASVICMFPKLKSLDFAKVTEDEKDQAKLHIIVNNSNVKKYSL